MQVRQTAPIAALLFLLISTVHAQPNPTASDATARVAGDVVSVYATLNNPSMYDIYVTSGESDAAGKVELYQGDKPASSLTVAAYGSLELAAGGPHVRLSQLKNQLKAGDEVKLTLQTDGGVAIAIAAVVK
jgi:copper(I)-binding protein